MSGYTIVKKPGSLLVWKGVCFLHAGYVDVKKYGAAYS